MRLLALTLAVALVASGPVISWVSDPVRPDETAIVLGDGFDDSSTVLITPAAGGGSTSVPVVSGQTALSTLKFIVPADLAYDAFSVVVITNGSQSPPVLINRAAPWWAQGDFGETASPGGWIRVFGANLAAPSALVRQLRGQLRDLKAIVTSQPGRTDDILADNSVLATAAAAIIALRAQLQAALNLSTTLRLTNAASGQQLLLPAAAANATDEAAWFYVPAGIPVAPTPAQNTWNIAVSNGLGGAGAFVPLDAFVSPQQPHVAGIVVAPPVSAWPPAGPVFTVSTPSQPMQPAINATGGGTFYPNGTSDAAVAAALAAAGAAGGGVVFFPRGTYFLTQPLVVPPRTVLAGAAAELTALVFAEATPATAPVAYISGAEPAPAAAASVNAARARGEALPVPSPTAWGLLDLTVYVTAFHYNVIDVSNLTDGFVMRRVRTRVNAFLSQNNPGTATHSRWSNWTLSQPGPVLQLNGRNFEVADCDLYGTYDVISSQRHSPCDKKSLSNNCHGAWFGVIARNEIWNGGAAHVMNQWNNVVFERNAILGVSVIAMGQAVGSAPWGGYDSHVFVEGNAYQFVYGNDREVMTFDDAGGAYFGTLDSVGGGGTTLVASGDCWLPQSPEWGGWAGGQVIVLNGTGAGQWRRIVVPNGSPPAAPGNRTWVIDAPFTVPPATTDGNAAGGGSSGASFVQVLPFRGRVIFARNRYADSGGFQFYGHAVSVTVSDNRFARFGGAIAWGQWRGWIPPPRANETAAAAAADAAADDAAGGWPLRGVMGNGMQPNLQHAWVDNVVTEGAGIVNYNISQPLANYYGFHAFVLLAAQSEGHATPTPHNYALALRRNAVLGNGGVWVGESSANVLVEASAVARSDNCVTVDAATALVLVRGSVCSSSGGGA